MRTVSTFTVLLLAMLTASPAWSQLATAGQRHIEILLAQFPDLRMVREDEMLNPDTAGVFSGAPGPVWGQPGPLYGNFNGDQRKDFAALLIHRRSYRELGMNIEGYSGFVAVCLSRGTTDFDCHLVRNFYIRLPGPNVNMVLYKEPPAKELTFRFLGRPKIEPPEYRNVGEGELDWNGKYRRVLGAKNVGKTYGHWSPDNPEASDLGYVRQPYETLVTRELFGYTFSYFWTPGLGILSCCGED